MFALPNIVVTQHAAYYSEEAIRTVRDFVACEVVRLLTGQPRSLPSTPASWRAAKET